MKQRKVKKELTLVTYWDYLRHFGREEGRKKWRKYKDEITIPAVAYEQMFGKEKVPEPTEEVKEVEVEKIPLEKAKDDIEHRGREINKMLRTRGWYKYLKPEIELIIKKYKDQYDNVNDIVELKINQKIREILQAILYFPEDCLEDAEIVKKEREEKQDALNSIGEESA